MLRLIMLCPFCQNNKLYLLQNEYLKCSLCKTKFSKKKYKMDILILEQFCNNINAHILSKNLNLNYRTVQKRYLYYRKLIALYLQKVYENAKHENSSYEEYYHFNIRDKKKVISKAINIMGFYSNNKVFTLLMPKRNIQEQEQYLKQYLSWNKMQSKDSYKTKLHIFWKYLDNNLKKHKGVEEEYFFYYLKEYEFKFNYLYNEQIQILKKLYFSK